MVCSILSNNHSIHVWPANVCSWVGGLRTGEGDERDCPTEYSASLEAVEVSRGNISFSTRLQVLHTASLLSVKFGFF